MIDDEALRRFGLREAPFSAVHDGGRFYVGPQHREALGFLERALHSNDLLVSLTGEAGVGKMATLKFALKQTLPTALVATLAAGTDYADGFLASLLRGFGFEGVNARREEMRGLLTVYLGRQREKGVTTAIVAQNPEVVSAEFIDEVGWLSLLEPVRVGRLKLVLLGDDTLERQLAAPRMQALRQMIRWQHRLETLGLEETRDYLDFHAQAAGSPNPSGLFSPEAVARIHALSGGLPKRINQFSTQAMMVAAAAGESRIDGRHVQPPDPGQSDETRPRPRRLAALDILLDREPKARIRLSSTRLLLGRHPWNDVQLDHDSVSRYHAMLVRESGHWTVVDLNSTNGIRVNDRETKQQRLRHGDIVSIGRFRLVLSDGVAPARNLPSVGDVSETTILRG
ncbi:MAG: FHA domain-containing protein [Gammaproteobacteria bacterium]